MNEQQLDRFYTEAVYRTEPTDEVKEKKEGDIKNRGILYHVIKEVSSQFDGHPVNNVLDIGGGTGSNLSILREYVNINRATSSDIFVPEKPLESISYIKSPVEELASNMQPGSMDLILMLEVIEHLFDPDAAMETVDKLLKDDGIFIISTPNLSSLVNRFMLLLGLLPWNMEVSSRLVFGRPRIDSYKNKGHEVVGHLRLFTFNTLIEFLEYYGWKIQKAYTLPMKYPTPKRRHFIRRLDYCKYHLAYLFIEATERVSVKLRKTLGTNIVVVCKKG